MKAQLFLSGFEGMLPQEILLAISGRLKEEITKMLQLSFGASPPKQYLWFGVCYQS